MEVDTQGAEHDEPEMSFRRGYQHGAIEVFYAIERFLDPATRKVLQAWIEKDVYIWRVKAMLGRPPKWRLTAAFSAGGDGGRRSPEAAAGEGTMTVRLPRVGMASFVAGAVSSGAWASLVGDHFLVHER